MEAVEFRCPWCTEMARVPVGHLVVSESPASLLMECPVCNRSGVVQIDDEIVDTLRKLGVTMTTPLARSRASHPAGSRRKREVANPHTHEGPPVSWDDLLDFHELLERDDWFDGLAALVV